MKSPFRLLPALALAAAAALAPACSSSAKRSSVAASGASESAVRAAALSNGAAAARALRVERVAYNLWFGLDEARDDYEGRVTAIFDYRPDSSALGAKDEPLFLDFEEGAVRSLTLNGIALEKRHDGHRILLKADELRAGSNRVEIAFSHPYSHNGAGLHRFQDPADGLVYLYSNFEPYDAHRMFPCFDQPDLKASFELTVEAPAKWQVISNTAERQVSKVDGRRSWQFPPSPLLSTYVFAMHAGPYATWEGDANGIPMRLFARQSLKQYVDHKEWLEITRRGLAYYAEYFGYPYPYGKYDQLVVPDFNAGAMENAGAVTFNERHIYRSKVTADRRRDRANTILHEMAHMWFGDLVTMKWWNGLWLNESFATFMAAKAVDEAADLKGTWQDFFDEKEWAYREDQLVTNHPIEVPVRDTDEAQSNFDGITYGKGAASLRQLGYWLGDAKFRQGLQRYFRKYALRNTTVDDFIYSLQEASGFNLGPWQKSWLQTSGVNSVRADWACGADGEVSRFILRQSPPEIGTPELRPHRATIALYRKQGASLAPYKTAEVRFEGAETRIEALEGVPCPELVYPNHADYDFVKIELDPVSLATARESTGRIADPLARQMLWHTLWEQVVDGRMRPQDFGDAVLAQAARETNTPVLSQLLEALDDPYRDHPSAMRYLSGAERARFRARLEKLAREGMMRSPAGGDAQLVWYHAFVDAAASPKALKLARGLLSGSARVRGLKIDQERRWELIQALARGGDADAPRLIQAELKRDNTDMGQKEAIQAEASLPSTESKNLWLGRILKQELPFPKLRSAMRAFHVVGQEDLSRLAVDAYFDTVPKLGASADESYAQEFAERMYPDLCDPAIIARTTETLRTHPELPAFVVKSLKIGRQEQERCVRARAKSLEPGRG